MSIIFRFFSTLTFRKHYHALDPAALIKLCMPKLLKILNKMSYEFNLGIELTDKGILHFHIIGIANNVIQYRLFKQYWIKYGFAKHEMLDPTDNEQYKRVKDYCEKEHWQTVIALYENHHYFFIEANNSICKDNMRAYAQLFGIPHRTAKRGIPTGALYKYLKL